MSRCARPDSVGANRCHVKLEELKQAVHETDPAAVMVSPRVLRRVIKAEQKNRFFFTPVPQCESYCVSRENLFHYADEDELDIRPEAVLPSTVILLPRPSLEDLKALSHDELLWQYWRRLFQAHIRLRLRERAASGELTAVDVQPRMNAVGATVFEEVRQVLEQEGLVLSGSDDLSVYIEFAAAYLELQYFRPNLRSTYFPAIRDYDAVEQLLATDVDAECIFASTRLPNASQPEIRTDPRSDEPHDTFWRLMRQADRARQQNDTVHAAIYHGRAARVAPAAHNLSTRELVSADLGHLAARMMEAFRLAPEDAAAWIEVLPSLLDKALEGDGVETFFLTDLQLACVESERKLYVLDLVEWALSVGHRPLQRPLSSLQLVRMVQCLRRARQRLTAARVTDADRARLVTLVEAAHAQIVVRARERFCPILAAAFEDAGLVAHNPPEQVALAKMLDELADKIIDQGYLSFSDLRDTISRNQLKLDDMNDPYEFRRGDALVRLDRRLAGRMDGVYRRGEFYQRWLERAGSLLFGTEPGRFVCRDVILPFGMSYLVLMLFEYFLQVEVGLQVNLLPWLTCWFLGAFVLAVRYIESFKQRVTTLSKQALAGLYYTCWEFPIEVSNLPPLRRFLRSWPWLIAYWYFFKPLLLFVPLLLIFGAWVDTPGRKLLLLLAAVVAVNSRFGYLASEASWEAATLMVERFRFEVLDSVLRGIMYFFKRVAATVESILYRVEDWLRLRGEAGHVSLAVRSVLSVCWFPIAFLTRLLFTVAVEPNINPIKLVFSFLVAKILIPFVPAVMPALTHAFTPFFSAIVSGTLATLVMFWVIPGATTFLIWEIRENWMLFRANRPQRLEPVAIGNHGETMRELLVPGFHSGTIPHLQKQLRHAECSAYETTNWRLARHYRNELAEVADAIQVCLERETISLIRQSGMWQGPLFTIGLVELACHAVRIEFCHPSYPHDPMGLLIEHREHRLFASIERTGWLARIDDWQQAIFSLALAGFYKVAGVDVVFEQLFADLPDGWQHVDARGERWIIARRGHLGEPIHYDLFERGARLIPRNRFGHAVDSAPWLEPSEAVFGRISLTWQHWVECWIARDPLSATCRQVTSHLLPSGSGGYRPLYQRIESRSAGDDDSPASGGGASGVSRSMHPAEGATGNGGSPTGERSSPRDRASSDDGATRDETVERGNTPHRDEIESRAGDSESSQRCDRSLAEDTPGPAAEAIGEPVS